VQLPVAVHTNAPLLHVLPPQQRCPFAPHSHLAVVVLQVRFPLHDDPAQQSCPTAPPHIVQDVAEHTRLVVLQPVPPQHAWPLFPHWQLPPAHVRLVLQVIPMQQGCPLPPHWQLLTAVTQVRLELHVPLQQALFWVPQPWHVPPVQASAAELQVVPLQHA
jgi:hypothetical protein